MAREIVIWILEYEEVDTREQQDRNSLWGVGRIHQVEDVGLAGDSFGQPAVERGRGPKGAREAGEPVGEFLHESNRRRSLVEMNTAERSIC
jgi:hypothetical protein